MKDKKYITDFRVEYSHTDKMGYVHHAQYLVYYEFARWEYLRLLGQSYKVIEDSGIMMPVISAKLEYLKPAFYDDILHISTEVEIDEAKFIFKHQIVNDKNELINIGKIIVVCIDHNTRKPVKPNQNLKNIFL